MPTQIPKHETADFAASNHRLGRAVSPISDLLDRWFCRGLEASSRIASRRAPSIVLIGVIAFAFGAGRSLIWNPPVPFVLDEFCYLLASDTFASGRLTNPAHPMWVHFETIFVNQQPTYSSKYPPGQGAALAIGQRLFSRPIIGVWLSTAAACAAIYWMLLEWTPPAWALLGAFVCMTRLVAQYWDYSYWGGSVAALGGALVFGAARQLTARRRFREGCLLGLGLAILANTRPFEGVLTTFILFLFLFLFIPAVRRFSGRDWYRIGISTSLILIPAAAAMALYDFRVTGDPLQMPYQVNSRTYFPVPFTILGHAGSKPTMFRHKEIEEMYDHLLTEYHEQRSLSGFAKASLKKLAGSWNFYLGPVLTVSLIGLPFLLKTPWNRVAMWTCGVSIAAMLFGAAVHPHYIAPLAGLIYALIALSMERLSAWRWRYVPLGVLGVLIILAFHASLLAASLLHRPGYVASNQPWAVERTKILERMGAGTRQHLILVRYAPGHDYTHEWVYNRADIDRAKIVWARDMGASKNHELLDYFGTRDTWLLEADLNPPKLSQLR